MHFRVMSGSAMHIYLARLYKSWSDILYVRQLIHSTSCTTYVLVPVRVYALLIDFTYILTLVLLAVKCLYVCESISSPVENISSPLRTFAQGHEISLINIQPFINRSVGRYTTVQYRYVMVHMYR